MDVLEGKVGVVTGAGSGIGLALAERFAQEGMAVVMADVETGALDAAAAKVEAHGTDVLAVPTDVTDAKAVEALAAAARDRFGTFHVVCNNAGVAGRGGRSWESDPADWEWVLGVNLWGVINGIRAFVPTLVAQGEGHVVNTASLAAWMAIPGLSPYTVSKHAVLGLSETLAFELQASGSPVGVSVVCPGFVSTRIHESERNWPAALGDPPAARDDPLTTAIRGMFDRSIAGGVAPASVADAVVDAIGAGRFLVTTHPEEVAVAADRRAGVARGDAPRLFG